jgi:GTP-dependent phosphoenolpyruvate carboxykinase
LIGDEQSRGMTMQQIVKIISDVWAKAYGVQPAAIQFYEPAQLVIVTGTPDQIDFIEQTLVALRKKAELNRMEHSKSAGSDSKTAGPKSDASTGSK